MRALRDDFIARVVGHPEWEKIREELTPDSGGWHQEFDLGGGARVHIGGPTESYNGKNADLFSELCSFVNQPEGY